jgi:hypothetical protein
MDVAAVISLALLSALIAGFLLMGLGFLRHTWGPTGQQQPLAALAVIAGVVMALIGRRVEVRSAGRIAEPVGWAIAVTGVLIVWS